MIISHNLTAMNAQREYQITTGEKAKRAERLSSGFKIGRAADDAAGLCISEKMRHQIRGLNQGLDNIKEGVGYCQIADGALHEVHDMLQRMNELAIKAANGTNSSDGREGIDREIQHLKTEMDRICETTKYNEEYLFKGEEEPDTYHEVYDLQFSGYPDDIYIYNDSYDAATGTATYGGIAWQGKRYAWSAISPGMYNAATGMFQPGSYTLKAEDGTRLKLTCEAGSKPPQVTREFEAAAGYEGIHINGELIGWEHVRTASGRPLNKDDIANEPYYFSYHGFTASFTPEMGDEFFDVVQKITGTRWKSTYQVPTEEEALFADFGDTYITFADNDEVKAFIEKKADFSSVEYTICAGDGTGGTFDGIWLEENGTAVAGSHKSWADMGIANWGDQSKDIWEDKTYKYSYAINAEAELRFSWQMLNETSKDSVIDALNGVKLEGLQSASVSNHAALTVDSAAYANVLSGTVTRDFLSLTLEEEYGLGRDYTKDKDTFGSAGLQFDGKQFTVGYTNTRDGNTTTKEYRDTEADTNKLVTKIQKKITDSMNAYLKVVAARYRAGAAKPNDTNLTSLISPGNITGGGGSSYLKDVITLDPADPDLKSTLHLGSKTDYAGAYIDFSGLGANFQPADLIGMGFDSTCQTCSNHYSIQFVTREIIDPAWQETEINNKKYGYYYERQGQNYTLYIDMDSMMTNGVSDGVEFAGTMLEIIDAADYDFHFSQYAAFANDSRLYVFDNRPGYVENGVSQATDASFSPYAYGLNTITEFDFTLFDENNAGESVSMKFEYDYSSLFSPDKLKIDYIPSADGEYIYDAASGSYEKYDPANPAHAGLDRYKIQNVSLDTQGKPLEQYLDEYIRDTILGDVAKASRMDLVSEAAKYRITGDANDNKAMITEANTPQQIMPQRKGESLADGLRIQCSANGRDYIYIPRQKLSVNRMGLRKLNVKTEGQAYKAIAMLDAALKKVSDIRSKFGAYQNRLEHAANNVANIAENTTAAESRIRDTDVAREMAAFSMLNILSQTGEAMMSQANMSKQGVLALLQ